MSNDLVYSFRRLVNVLLLHWVLSCATLISSVWIMGGCAVISKYWLGSARSSQEWRGVGGGERGLHRVVM